MPFGTPTERPTLQQQARSRCGVSGGAARERLERQHDQRVAGQHRQRLAEGAMDRGLAAPRVGVVETGQIVVHQRGAMQQLDRGGGGVGDVRVVLAAGGGDASARRGRMRAPRGKHRVTHGGGQQRRTARLRRPGRGGFSSSLDSRHGVHADASPECVLSGLIVTMQTVMEY